MRASHQLMASISSRAPTVVLLIILAVHLAHLHSSLLVVGREQTPASVEDPEIERLLKRLNKPTVKSLHTEHGDIFDCVNIYEQPAFDHPLLRNHTIQMKPSSSSKPSKDKIPQTSSNASLGINLIGRRCPKGTVPIRRVTKEDLLRARSFSKFGSKHVNSMSSLGTCSANILHAGLHTTKGKFYGTRAKLNIWEPNVPDGYSSAEVAIGNGEHEIQAGWIVNPSLFNDSKSRLFAQWTVDNYRNTGCYNLLCPGFVQTGVLPLGHVIDGISSYGDESHQYDIPFYIFRDPVSHHWWLEVGTIDIKIGYWPKEVVTKLGDGGATDMFWGGEVCTPDYKWRGYEMGSGHFPNEGFSKAASISSVRYAREERNPALEDPEPHKVFASSDVPKCFDVSDIQRDDVWGLYVFYGGVSHKDYACNDGLKKLN